MIEEISGGGHSHLSAFVVQYGVPQTCVLSITWELVRATDS